MPATLRCASKKYAEVINDHVIEVKCSSRFCGAAKGVVVLHRLDLITGECTTRTFNEPPHRRK
jgi:hypothetical protein